MAGLISKVYLSSDHAGIELRKTVASHLDAAGAGSDVTVEGSFVDLGTDGALVLRDNKGVERRITTGDVELTGRL